MINSQSLSEIQIAKCLCVDVNVQMLWNTLHVLWKKSPDPKSAINYSIVSKLKCMTALNLDYLLFDQTVYVYIKLEWKWLAIEMASIL